MARVVLMAEGFEASPGQTATDGAGGLNIMNTEAVLTCSYSGTEQYLH